MRLKLIVIDFELSPRVRRFLFRVVLPLAMLLGATAIAYAAVPVVFVTGQPLTHDELNQNFNGLDVRLTSLETTGPRNATHAMTADAANHATTADSALRASSADVANALGPGPIPAGLIPVHVTDPTTSAACVKGSTTSTVDCQCPEGTFVLSGGGFTLNPNYIRESRPFGTGWRITCASPSGDVLCNSYDIVCSRITQ